MGVGVAEKGSGFGGSGVRMNRAPPFFCSFYYFVVFYFMNTITLINILFLSNYPNTIAFIFSLVLYQVNNAEISSLNLILTIKCQCRKIIISSKLRTRRELIYHKLAYFTLNLVKSI